MSLTWIVVAESSRARIFASKGPRASLDEIEGLARPAARLKESDLVSDSPGRAFDSGGQGRHAMGREADQKRHEAEVFARMIADRLEAARVRRSYEQLILLAPPEFLGLLRKTLSQTCIDKVVATVNKNLVQHDPADIRDHLPESY